MPQWKLNHFTNLCHLAAATADVIVPDIIGPFLVFSLYRLSFTMDFSIWSTYTVLVWVHFYDFELYRVHCGTNKEQISLSKGTIRFQE
eukprot:gene37427-44893_t